MRAFLRLIRLPNTLTAFADVFAGATLAGLDPLHSGWSALVPALGSALLYAGGVGLNDVFDAAKDRTLHPDRPIPSGAISRGTAAIVSSLLLFAGILSSLVACRDHQVLTVALALAILGYDLLPERLRGLAVLIMGVCRSLNVLRGATLLTGDIAQPAMLGAASHLWLVASITLVSTLEDRGQPGRRSCIKAALLLMTAYLAPAIVAGGPFSPAGIIATGGAVALAIYTASPLLGSEPAVGQSVRRAVFTLILVDALYAMAMGRWETALLLALLYPLMPLLARAIRQRGS